MKPRRRRSADMPARERNRPLRVVVSVEERIQIEAAASRTGLSVSAYLRALGLGYQPASAYDHEAVFALASVAGDLGRLGGLLKWWLSERADEGAREYDVAQLLRSLEATTADLRGKLDRV